jgi:hypothetical protein
MICRITIPTRFPSLNEFIAANRQRRGNWSGGNAMKHRDQKTICQYIPKGLRFKRKIFIEYNFFEPNTKRDKDNISGYFHKIFQDALVERGCIPDDGWKYIKGMADYFDVDAKYPRVEVVIEECK